MASQDSTQCTQTQPLSYEDDDLEDEAWGRLVPLKECSEKYATFHLTDDEYFFGRNKQKCAVVLEEPQISGLHCRIYRDASRGDNTSPMIWVYDLSSNGTFVNNRLIGKTSKALLADGDELLFINLAKTRRGKKGRSAPKTERVGYKFYLTESGDDTIRGKYLIGDIIGSGSFARVYKGTDKRTAEEVAIKEIDKEKYVLKQTSRRPDTIMDEVHILQAVAHDNIIKVFDCFDTPDKLYLVMEMANGGELFARISRHKKLSEPVAHDVFSQMFEAIAYLHRKEIVHRDLKPENILMKSSDSWKIKISDFGLSRILPDQHGCTTLCGTPYYLAPEILKRRENGGYGREVDYWSMGVILYVMLCGHPPYDDRMGNLLDLVKEGDFIKPPVTWDALSHEAQDLIDRLMCVDVGARLNEIGVRNHPWMVYHQRLKMRNAGNGLVGSKRQRADFIGDNDTDMRESKRMRFDTPQKKQNFVIPARMVAVHNYEERQADLMVTDTKPVNVTVVDQEQCSPLDLLSGQSESMDGVMQESIPRPMFTNENGARPVRARDTDGDWLMKPMDQHMMRHMSVD